MLIYNSKLGDTKVDKIVDKAKYRPRILDEQVEKYLKTFGAICIEGPKWCGKTWIASYHAKSKFLIADPHDNYQNKRLAKLSPSIILEGDTPRLIDEWQEVEQIWDAVRYVIDKRGRKGQFILTGSSTSQLINHLHSGAGRIGRLKMRTMSLYESGDSSGTISLKDICDGKAKPQLVKETNLKNLAYFIVRGGFPGAIDFPFENAQMIAESYIETILNEDTKKLDGKNYNIHKMRLLLKSLARNESTTATITKLANDIKDIDDKTIDYDTVMTYLDVFERLFLLDNLAPYESNIRSSIRVKQSEKRHLCDPSLTCALLNLTPEKLINDLNTFGFLFEALCERDLRIYAESFDGKLFHYQDYDNNEIDAVIELKDGRWCAFEIKLGGNQVDKAAENLLKIKNKIVLKGGKKPSIMGVICGLGNAFYQREDGVYVIPITALKN